MAATLARLLRQRTDSDPDAVAYADRDREVTYGELLHDAAALAATLDAEGVRAGERVALCLDAGLDWVRHFWAVQLHGATSVAINPHVPRETMLKRAGRVRPRLVITEPLAPRHAHSLASRDDEPLVPRPPDPLPRHPERSEGSQNTTTVPSGEELAFLQPTSGTSGEPRAVMIRHRNLFAVLRASEEALGIDSSDILVSWVPPWHDLGLVRFIIGTVYAGARCHIVPPSIATIPEWLATIGRVRGTLTGAPDFAYRLATRLVDPAKVDLSSLRYATDGGEPIRHGTITAFHQRFGLRNIILPGYGLAEATLGVAGLLPGDATSVDERGNVSCGKPFPGVEVRIAGDGEILVRGEGVFAGYFEAPDATAAALRDGWLHTGDVGYQDGDGNLYVLGRKRAMLKRGGAVLAPRELEEVAQEVAGVKVAAAVGLAGGSATEETAIVIEAEGDPAAISDAVAAAIQRALGFAPEHVVVVASRGIPRTANGKIRHDMLRQALTDGQLPVVFRR